MRWYEPDKSRGLRPVPWGVNKIFRNKKINSVGESMSGDNKKRGVNNKIYQSRLRPGATRIDLNGEPAGTVTAGEAAFARAKERGRKEQRPTPSSPPRSSLAELRAAGQRRKAEAAS